MPTRYAVVVNHEEQYSLWPESADLPAGWRDTGVHGSRPECLAHIDRVWTDMRPSSLRPESVISTSCGEMTRHD